MNPPIISVNRLPRAAAPAVLCLAAAVTLFSGTPLPATGELPDPAAWQASLRDGVDLATRRPAGDEVHTSIEELRSHVAALAPVPRDQLAAYIEPVRVELALAGDAGVIESLLLLGDARASTDPADAIEHYREAAQRYDLVEQWGNAVDANLRIIELDPRGEAVEGARRGILVQIELLRTREDDSDPASFDALEPILQRATKRRIHAASMLLGERLRALGRHEDSFAAFQAAAKRGYAPAMIQTGLMYSNGDGVERDMEMASSWLRPANVKGDPLGKFLLAECFLYGKGVPVNRDLALSLLNQAVEMDNPGRAYDLLATCHHKGWGVEPDHEKAVAFYRAACRDGFYNAYANLAVLYMRGDGVETNRAQAVKLLLNGIEEDNPLCMYFYAVAHLDGMGVERDAATAHRWFKRAARAGSPQARAWCADHDIGWK